MTGSPFSDVVTAALTRELTRRRRLDPHAQLGLGSHAGREDILFAAARLRERYDPLQFEVYGAAAVDAARSICALIDHALGLVAEPCPCALPDYKELRSRLGE